MDFSKKLTMPKVLFGAGMLVAFIGFLMPMTKINKSYFEEKKVEYETIAESYNALAKRLSGQAQAYQEEIDGYIDYSGVTVPGLEEQRKTALEKATNLRSFIESAPTQAELEQMMREAAANMGGLSSEETSDLIAELTTRGDGLKAIDLDGQEGNLRGTLDKAFSTVKATAEGATYESNRVGMKKSKETLEIEAFTLEATADTLTRKIDSNQKLIRKNISSANSNKKIADSYTAKAEKMGKYIEKMEAVAAKGGDAVQAKADAIVAKAEANGEKRMEVAVAKESAARAKYDTKEKAVKDAGQKKYDAKAPGVAKKTESIMAAAEKKHEKARAAAEKKGAKILAKANAKYEKMRPESEKKIAEYLKEPTDNMAAAKTESAEKIARVIAEAQAILNAELENIMNNPEKATKRAVEEAKASAAEKIATAQKEVNDRLYDAETKMAFATQAANIEKAKLEQVKIVAQEEVDALYRHADKIIEKAEAQCALLEKDLNDILEDAELKAMFLEDEIEHIIAKAEETNEKEMEKAEALASDMVDGALAVRAKTAAIILNKPGIAYLSTFLWAVLLACLAGIVVYIITDKIVYSYLCWLIGCGFGIASISSLAAEFKLGLFAFAGAGSWIIFIGMTAALVGLLSASLDKKPAQN